MEENDDSFIIDVDKLMLDFDKFLKSLHGAVFESKTRETSGPSNLEIESMFQKNQFPDFDRDIIPLIRQIDSINRSKIESQFAGIKDDLSIYQVIAYFLVSIYKVNLISIVLRVSSESTCCCSACWSEP